MAIETIYDHPRYYDVLFSWDRTVETEFYHRALERCGITNADAVLEVACGTGRVAIGLAQRGRRVYGLDMSAGMIEYLQRAAVASRVDVGTLCADMCAFDAKQRFAGACNPMSSLRLLADDASARAHLRAMAANMRPGGAYIVDLTLAASLDDPPETTSETWEMTRDGVTVRAEDRKIFVNENGVERVLAWGQELHLRSYTTASFTDLVKSMPEFELESWHPEFSRATGVSEFPHEPSPPPASGRTMVVLRRV